MAELAFIAHYPFTSEAKLYVSERGLQLTSTLVGKAEERLTEAVKSGKLRRAPKLSDALEEELSLYAACRMIVSCANNRYLINRYAVAEAKRSSDYLSNDDKAREEWLAEVAGELGIAFEKQGARFLVPLAAYLTFTPRSVDYKLSNREVAGGKVAVNNHERVRMIEEAVKKKIEGELPIRAEFPPDVKAAAARILALLPKLEGSIVRIGQENYPPCIRRLLEELSMNINLPHTARVALAIYLIKSGMTDEKVVNIFRGAPDFSEKTTTYQVSYLRTKGYSMPSCTTMDSYGICVAECRCGSPLNFRQEIHGRYLKQEEKA